MTNNNSFPSRSEINEWIAQIKTDDKIKHGNGVSGWFWILSYDEISLLVQKAADRELDACCDWIDENDITIRSLI